jgi:hypothetical protein
VIREETAATLDEFLRFRHLFRNVYGFELEWPRARGLLRRLPEAWNEVEVDLDGFLGFLDTASAAR